MQTTTAVGSGHGKLILFGEHAVVYGQPAIVAGLARGATASVVEASDNRLDIVDGATGQTHARVTPSDDSPLARACAAILAHFELPASVHAQVTIDVPIGCGLGSSAAMAAALARALAAHCGQDDDARIEVAVSASETVFHANPSGIDQAAALRGGVFVFRRGTPPEIRPLEVEPLTLVVCRADEPASTAAMVERVGQLHRRRPDVAGALDALVGQIVAEAEPAIERADWAAVGDLMNVNHGLLAAMGVSTHALDRACHVAREAGALGAKLTGAGGGGCVVALAESSTRQDVLGAWREDGWPAFEIPVS